MAVTIGLPFKNEGTQLLHAVQSIIQQDMPDWELILVGDGPSKDSVRASKMITDPRIRLVLHDHSQGLAKRLNEIADLATYPILFRMDADDVMVPSRLRCQSDFLCTNPNIDVVSTLAYVIDENLVIRGMYSELDLPHNPEGFLKNGRITHPTVAARTEWFRANRYDETRARAQDKELWIRTSRHTRFGKLRRPLLFYRLDSRTFLRRRNLSAKADRTIVSKAGPAAVGYPATIRYLAQAIAKDAMYRVLVKAVSPDALYERRTKKLSDPEYDIARQLLQVAIGASQEAGGAR